MFPPMFFAYIIYKFLLCESLLASSPNYLFDRCILQCANTDTKVNTSSLILIIS